MNLPILITLHSKRQRGWERERETERQRELYREAQNGYTKLEDGVGLGKGQGVETASVVKPHFNAHTEQGRPVNQLKATNLTVCDLKARSWRISDPIPWEQSNSSWKGPNDGGGDISPSTTSELCVDLFLQSRPIAPPTFQVTAWFYLTCRVMSEWPWPQELFEIINVDFCLSYCLLG
jgi:hypothetical protein